MPRTYLQTTALAVAGVGLALLAEGQARPAVFDSKPLQQERFAVLAQPIGQGDWKLLVLEQIKQRPLCWTPRADGLIEPTLNSFNFSGICSRYLDSNGYSLRSGGQDQTSRFRLRLVQNGRNLELQALDPGQAMPIRIGTASIPRRDRNGFVRVQLDPSWTLERRVYKGRTLSHLYFAHPEPVNQLLAKSGESGSGFGRLGAPRQPGRPTPRTRQMASSESGPIRLEVIPYRP